MKTIENLKEEKIIYKTEKDENGNLIEVPHKKMTSRFVETVTPGIRFGYYLIDLVLIYVLAFILGIVFALLGISDFIVDGPGGNIFGFLIVFSYYLLLEGLTGTTAGKMILGYTVIDRFAEKPSFGAITIRSLSRLVPFEAFSCFNDRGWHDKWSKTYVVKTAEKNALKKLMGSLNDDNGLLD